MPVEQPLACLALWEPKVHAYVKKYVDEVFNKYPDLRRAFPGSAYPAAAFNFGPKVCTFKHRDVLNCPFGFCAIQALGCFDPKKGGHLILWELKLVVEFPPGSLILILSAIITHSNTPLAEGDMRASFTQYVSGGLFRFVDSGFLLEKDLRKKDPCRYNEAVSARSDRWKTGLDLISNLEDLHNEEQGLE